MINYIYNSFVRSLGLSFADPTHREKPPQMAHHYLWGSKQLNLAYTSIFGQYAG